MPASQPQHRAENAAGTRENQRGTLFPWPHSSGVPALVGTYLIPADRTSNLRDGAFRYLFLMASSARPVHVRGNRYGIIVVRAVLGECRRADTEFLSYMQYYNRASEHPSCYVIDEKR